MTLRLLGLEPILEGGWWHKGRRARRWDVEDRLTAVAVLGDVTVDLAEANSAPPEIVVGAWAILRDVDIIVTDGSAVELSGGGLWGHLSDQAGPHGELADGVIRIVGHTLAGDVTVRTASHPRESTAPPVE